MNWRSVSRMFALGVILAPAAHAGWYIAFFAGLNDVDDTTIATDLGTLDTSYDLGVAWSIAGGYEFERFRVEGEILSERENDVDVHRLDGVELQGRSRDFTSADLERHRRKLRVSRSNTQETGVTPKGDPCSDLEKIEGFRRRA